MVWRLVTLLVLTTVALWPGAAFAENSGSSQSDKSLGKVQHIVVIYDENHSFDNLYGGWEGVNGVAAASPRRTIQVGRGGAPYACLAQNDVNLTSPPLPVTCTANSTSLTISSDFPNAPFTIDKFIPATATTCPHPGVFAPNGTLNGTGLPGGC